MKGASKRLIGSSVPNPTALGFSEVPHKRNEKNMDENDKDKSIPPVPYRRFKELVDKNKELKSENDKLRAQIEILERILKERLRNK